MAQVVQPDRWQVGVAHEQAEAAAGVAGVDRCAVGADEHVAGVVPGLAGGEAPLALSQLAATVFAQDLDGVFVQGDRAGPGGGFGSPSTTM